MMKKFFVIFSAIVALAACAKVAPVVEEPAEEANREIKVNITITRSGADDTKASVKTGWASGDVVFVFFKGVAAPKYLAMTYDGSAWGTDLGDITDEDLTAAAAAEDRKMTAVYLPYGSTYKVVDNGSNFTIKDKNDLSGNDYCGHFYLCQAGYDYSASVISGSISLVAAQPLDGDDKLVHFDVTGYTRGNTYVLDQDYMKPMSLSSISEDGDVTITEGEMGDAIPGYEDATFMSFSGILDATAVNVSKTYRFLIHDKTTGTAYFRQIAADQKISANKYIGIGAISGWASVSSPYFSVAPTKIVSFASGNLQATYTVAGGWNWHFATNQYDYIGDGGGETVGNEMVTSTSPYISGEGTVDLFGWSTENTYFGIHSSEDNATYEGDFVDWGSNVAGSWRTPSRDEWTYFFRVKNLSRFGLATVCGVNGCVLLPDSYSGEFTPMTYRVDTYFGKYTDNVYSTNADWLVMQNKGAIFLPAAGFRKGIVPQRLNSQAFYWSSTPHATAPGQAVGISFYGNHWGLDDGGRLYSNSVRLIQDLVPTTVSRDGSATAEGFDFE